MRADRFRPDAALVPLIPRIECFMCQGEPEPCPACLDAMVAEIAAADHPEVSK